MDGLGTGDALVVDFVAASRPLSMTALTPVTEAVSPTSAEQAADEASGKKASADPASVSEKIISQSDELAVPSSTTPAAARAPAPTASASASGAGSATDDLHARYHAALRIAIAKTWQGLSERPFPSGCALDLSQARIRTQDGLGVSAIQRATRGIWLIKAGAVI